jgi:hypothetical protein
LKPEDILAYLGNYPCFCTSQFHHFIMSFMRIAAIAGVVAFASAHGTVTGIVADGV